ncbi:Peptidase inhibitor 16 [Taenia solium]|eukprot:TsM_000370600 transcript=TsM_000370600 gene=TsM_000370600
MRRCDGLRPHWSNPQYLTVCQYKPGGNYVGQRPYRFGQSCNRCPRGYVCRRKQCVRRDEANDVYPTAKLENADDRSVPAYNATLSMLRVALEEGLSPFILISAATRRRSTDAEQEQFLESSLEVGRSSLNVSSGLNRVNKASVWQLAQLLTGDWRWLWGQEMG